MVLFENINVNQEVEVKWHGGVRKGKVRYKGPINGFRGDWVGVELYANVGRHDGMLQGRRYFSCPPDHGIFTTAEFIRFIPLKRNLYSSYRPLSPEFLPDDEDLFRKHSEDRGERFGVINDYHYNRARKGFDETFEYPSHSYHLRHSVSNNIPAATVMRPETTKARINFTDHIDLLDLEDDLHGYEEPFCRSPSIPQTHMPRSAAKRQVARGWDGARFPCRFSARGDFVQY